MLDLIDEDPAGSSNNVGHQDWHELHEFTDVEMQQKWIRSELESIYASSNDIADETEVLQEEARLESGDVLHTWKIGGFLNAGNEGGAVYWAHKVDDTGHVWPDTVVIKYPAQADEADALRTIGREGAIGFPELHYIGEWKRNIYIVMELLGPSLDDLSGSYEGSRGRPWPWLTVKYFGILLLDRLERVHRAGWVHCDLKPGNILLGKGKLSRYMIYLVDFGLARLIDDGDPFDGPQGTLQYNSIRANEGGQRHPLDDIESLGWLLCALFLGELPWHDVPNQPVSGEGSSRRKVSKQMTLMKQRVLTDPTNFIFDGRHFRVPGPLIEFLRSCQSVDVGQFDVAKDYKLLRSILAHSEDGSPLICEPLGSVRSCPYLRQWLSLVDTGGGWRIRDRLFKQEVISVAAWGQGFGHFRVLPPGRMFRKKTHDASEIFQVKMMPDILLPCTGRVWMGPKGAVWVEVGVGDEDLSSSGQCMWFLLEGSGFNVVGPLLEPVYSFDGKLYPLLRGEIESYMI